MRHKIDSIVSPGAMHATCFLVRCEVLNLILTRISDVSKLCLDVPCRWPST
jgi:hypothetical protein